MGKIKLEGAIDLHCHYGPDFINPAHNLQPSVTALQAAQEAAQAGFAAIVLKSHDFPTAALAYTLNQVVANVRTFGGITLDYQVGGLNARAVEHALRLGAKIVWLPTVASHQDYLNGLGPRLGYPGTGIRTTGDDGRLLPVVREILDLVAQHDAIVATGHITADENYAVAREFARRGRVIVTHAGEPAAGPHLTKAQCAELAGLGAFIELTAQECVPHLGYPPCPIREVAERIEAIGPRQCVLATDYGYSTEVPRPAPGMRDYVDGLWAAGVPEANLKLMAADNAARLLGLKG
jgi:predicted TIM-barrel fold metal-dependent hydrolase